MKKIIFILLPLLLSVNSQKIDYVSFAYFGATSDKPLDMLVISKQLVPDSQIPAPSDLSGPPMNELITPDNYSFVRMTVMSVKKISKKNFSVGFYITISDNGIIRQYFVNKKNSHSLLVKLIPFLKKDTRNNVVVSYLEAFKSKNESD